MVVVEVSCHDDRCRSARGFDCMPNAGCGHILYTDVYDQKTDFNFAKSATSAGKYTPLALAFPHVCLSNHYFIYNQCPAIAIERTECTNLPVAGGFDSFECSETCKLRLCK